MDTNIKINKIGNQFRGDVGVNRIEIIHTAILQNMLVYIPVKTRGDQEITSKIKPECLWTI
jgi:hypothetical protein